MMVLKSSANNVMVILDASHKDSCSWSSLIDNADDWATKSGLKEQRLHSRPSALVEIAYIIVCHDVLRAIYSYCWGCIGLIYASGYSVPAYLGYCLHHFHKNCD